MAPGEGGGEHAADRGVEHRFHSVPRDALRHAAERHARGLGKGCERVGDDQSADALAVPDGELERDEGAEAVAEYCSVAWQLERVHGARDVVGVIGHGFHFYGSRLAKARQVDSCYPAAG